MMKILVYNVAASDGGALVVLNNFYFDVMNHSPNDIEWVFITSQTQFSDAKNVDVLKYPKIKKSWLHRWLFETFKLKKIIKKINPDYMISLQNMPIKGVNLPQYVYLHQSLQYCPKKFSFLKKQERALAIRQRIICNIYKKHLPKAEHIFVQTEWIKQATAKWLNCGEEKLSIVPVEIKKPTFVDSHYYGFENKTFFYPARAELYKNHELIVKAVQLVVDEGYKDFKVVFTVSKSDNEYSNNLHKLAEGLPIDFIGTIDGNKVWEYYTKSILLFPSYLETCGLPLLEARECGAYILASDLPFSKEALDGYKNAEYFIFNSANDLAQRMIKLIKQKGDMSITPSDSVWHGESLMLKVLEKIKKNER